MLGDLNVILDGLTELEDKGIQTIDCRRAQFSAQEPIARLRVNGQSWKVTFQAEYSVGTASAHAGRSARWWSMPRSRQSLESETKAKPAVSQGWPSVQFCRAGEQAQRQPGAVRNLAASVASGGVPVINKTVCFRWSLGQLNASPRVAGTPPRNRMLRRLRMAS